MLIVVSYQVIHSFTMGCDGGTIPTRDELVRTKKKPEKKDRNADLAAKWKHCAISQEPLRSPVMACELGRLYNKESVLEFLIDRSQFEMASNFVHLRGLKDVKELQLTDNPNTVKSKAENGDSYIDMNISPYICPVTGLEMSGTYSFCYIWTCGCVVSERALKEIKTDICHKCGVSYRKNDVIRLNGDDEVLTTLRTRMEERRLQAKLNKKSKAGSKHKAETATSHSVDGATSSKMSKNDDTHESTKFKHPSTTDSLQNKADKSKLIKLDKNKASSKDNKIKQDKTISIQKDPNASKTYKSLFTSSAAGQNQRSAHWVTYNPMYY